MVADASIEELQALASKVGFKPIPGEPGSAKSRGFVMRDTVLASFVPWTIMFEGYTDFLYADSLGYVTTGIGNLVDPKSLALPLPWTRNGSPASQDEISAAWDTVKAAYPETQSFDSAKLTDLRLSKDAVAALVESKLREIDNALARDFSAYAGAPADAQLAICGMSWAMGEDFGGKFPAFKRAFDASDFGTAADESHISNGAGTRNAAHKLLLRNAAIVQSGGGDPDVLYYLDSPSGGSLLSVVAGTALAALAFFGVRLALKKGMI